MVERGFGDAATTDDTMLLWVRIIGVGYTPESVTSVFVVMKGRIFCVRHWSILSGRMFSRTPQEFGGFGIPFGVKFYKKGAGAIIVRDGP